MSKIDERKITTENRDVYYVSIFSDGTHDVYDASRFFKKKAYTTDSMSQVLSWIKSETGSEVKQNKKR